MEIKSSKIRGKIAAFTLNLLSSCPEKFWLNYSVQLQFYMLSRKGKNMD
jgi:hypothetical protein